jgi:hypothetical protein
MGWFDRFRDRHPEQSAASGLGHAGFDDDVFMDELEEFSDEYEPGSPSLTFEVQFGSERNVISVPVALSRQRRGRRRATASAEDCWKPAGVSADVAGRTLSGLVYVGEDRLRAPQHRSATKSAGRLPMKR